VVNKLGGVWMDIDRRYYNKNVGTGSTNFANIDLQPGYQRMTGKKALDFVRFRHTDSDLFRLARQQQFVSAARQQIAKSIGAARLQAVHQDSGRAGSAPNRDYQLGRKDYRLLLPPGNRPPNAPHWRYLHPKIYYDPARPGDGKIAAQQVSRRIGGADVEPLPA